MNDSTFCLIPLRGKHGDGKFVKVSPEDYEWLSKFNWFLSHDYPATSVRLGGRYPSRYMHRMIKLGADIESSTDLIDHENGDTLDNRRSNLRICTVSENLQNSRPRSGSVSTYKGVRWIKGRQWSASICVDGKRSYLGIYDSEIEAARVYDACARFYFVDFARTNFVEGESFSVDEALRRRRVATGKSSSFIGVRWRRLDECWLVRITTVQGGARKRLAHKTFKNELEAALYYDSKVKELGLKRRLNFEDTQI